MINHDTSQSLSNDGEHAVMSSKSERAMREQQCKFLGIISLQTLQFRAFSGSSEVTWRAVAACDLLNRSRNLQKFVKHHSKAKRRAPAYSRALFNYCYQRDFWSFCSR